MTSCPPEITRVDLLDVEAAQAGQRRDIVPALLVERHYAFKGETRSRDPPHRLPHGLNGSAAPVTDP
ncbi:hypothetical protein ABT373_11315 [Streptomyces sp. NPDC000070]|uniref:hypothetical protein n=1 Tax=Streptomyces sp. NPDC000070 TaxID=3154240 RepID=UPI003319F9CA